MYHVAHGCFSWRRRKSQRMFSLFIPYILYHSAHLFYPKYKNLKKTIRNKSCLCILICRQNHLVFCRQSLKKKKDRGQGYHSSSDLCFRAVKKPSLTSQLNFCQTYRTYLRLPLILSVIAFIVNFPAFFELDTVVCLSLTDSARFRYKVCIF